MPNFEMGRWLIWRSMRSLPDSHDRCGEPGRTGAAVPCAQSISPVITRASSQSPERTKWPSNSAPPSTSTERIPRRCNSSIIPGKGSEAMGNVTCSTRKSARTSCVNNRLGAALLYTMDPGGVMPFRSSTTRSGWRPEQSRAVSCGSSFSTVRLPTRMACSSVRHLCTSTSVSGEEMRCTTREDRGWRSRKPSWERAHFSTIYGRPAPTDPRNRRFNQRACASSIPNETVTPACRNRSIPRPFTSGKGSSWAITTCLTPRSKRRSTQGGVRP